MTEEERRRCCLLGGCGCGPGSAAQVQAMADVLRELGYPGNDEGMRNQATRLLRALGLDTDPPAWHSLKKEHDAGVAVDPDRPWKSAP